MLKRVRLKCIFPVHLKFKITSKVKNRGEGSVVKKKKEKKVYRKKINKVQ